MDGDSYMTFKVPSSHWSPFLIVGLFSFMMRFRSEVPRQVCGRPRCVCIGGKSGSLLRLRRVVIPSSAAMYGLEVLQGLPAGGLPSDV